MIVSHNLAAMDTQRQYNINVKKKEKTVEKLSSGYQINRAADDAAGLSISEKMRNQIRGLHQAANNVEDGISLIQTADGVLNEVHNITARQRELLVRAANEIHDEDDLQSIEDELAELGAEKDRIYKDTEFNGIKLFQGKDTVLAGPTTTVKNMTTYPIDTTKTTTKTGVLWVDKGTSAPADSHTEKTWTETGSFSATYGEEETVNSVNPDGHTVYDEKTSYSTSIYEDQYETITDVKYAKATADSKYTNLVKPGVMTGKNGYINVKNEAGDLDLSCAMSQLGVKMDGKLLTYDLYNDSKFTKTTTRSADEMTATTVYELGDGVKLSQKIELANGSYQISYSVENTGTNAHTVDVRLAFDTMNTSIVASKGHGATGFDLESDFAKIAVGGSGITKATLGNIGDLYDIWDDSKVTDGVDAGTHSGAGFWWEGKQIDGGNRIDVGSVTYGPIELKKDPYTVTTTITENHKREVGTTTTETTETILPQYLDIQSGANAGEDVPIRLYNISCDKMKDKVGKNQPVSAFHAAESLTHMDRVVKKISGIRSYYGAMQNRLEITYDNNLNYAENLESSESKLRDTDMATEVMNNSKFSILEQAAQSMLAQANKDSQSVLSLLQS